MSKEIPFGLHTVTPYLVVEDVVQLIGFLESVLGGSRRGDIKMRDDGSVQHAEVTIGDSVVMMGEPMERVNCMPGMLYVYVDDCDATYRHAIESGAEPVMEPADYPHGDRYGGVKDPVGNVWWVVTHTGKRE